MEYAFEDLERADLVIDAIYKGGSAPNMSAEPFHKLLPNCENSGGFRKVLRKDGSGKYAYVVLYLRWKNWNGRTIWMKKPVFFDTMVTTVSRVEN